jgi:hypothetical protein
VIDDPLALIDRYVEHRAQREVQVLDALAEGRHTVEAIADGIYPSLQQALVPMARESVLAHLLKLQAEGRATRAAEHWTLTS